MRLPGWEVVKPVDGIACDKVPAPPTEPDIVLRSESTVKDAFRAATEEVLGQPSVSVGSEWLAKSNKHSAPRGYVTVTVAMDNGNGQVKLEASRYGATPEQMADRDIFGYGDCELPQRRVLTDGTVLQLYPADTYDPEQPTQFVRVYQPNGLCYYIAAAGWSEEDAVRVGDSETIVGGRGKLPTTPQQLAEIAERLATKLK
jgi:hypothetical protein